MLAIDKKFKANPAQLTHGIEGLSKGLLALVVEGKQHDVIEEEEEAGSLVPTCESTASSIWP